MGYFRSDDNYIYLDCPSCEFYIPEYYFSEKKGGFATDMGNTIEVLGVFDVGFFDTNGKLVKMSVLNIPTWITINVYDSESKNVDLPGESEPVKCRVVSYMKNSKIMNSSIIESKNAISSYVSFILKGKVPNNVPYDKSLSIWRKNQELNGSGLGVPSVILELILSVSYRDKKNPYVKFSETISNNPSTSLYDYTMASIRQICQFNSTSTAITFEDIDSMITSSINRGVKREKEEYSPVESLLKL